MLRLARPFRRLTVLCLFWMCLAPALYAAAPEEVAGQAIEQAAQPDGQQSASAAPVETPIRVPQYSFGSYIKALGILCLAVVGLWFALWLLRRYNRSFRPMLAGLDRNALRVEAQLPFGPRRGLMVVRFEDERLLLGITEQHISPLASHPAAGGVSDGAGAGGAANPFSAFLDSFSRNRQSGAETPTPRPDGGSDA